MIKIGASVARTGAFLLGVGVCLLFQMAGYNMPPGDKSVETPKHRPSAELALATAKANITPTNPTTPLLDKQTIVSKHDCLPELAHEVIAREEPAMLLTICREHPQLASEILTLYSDLISESTLDEIIAGVPSEDVNGAFQALKRLAQTELSVRYIKNSPEEEAHRYVSQLPEEQQRFLCYALALGAPESASKLSDQFAGTQVSAFLDSCLDSFAARSVPVAVVNNLAASGASDSGLLGDCLTNWAVSSPLDAAAYIGTLPIPERNALRKSVSTFLKSYGAVQKQFDDALQQ